jgi:hypothetical protein
MRHSLKLIAAWGIFASMALFGTPPVAASPIVYTCCGAASQFQDHAILNSATGTITTSGNIGVLQPGDILDWDITITSVFAGSPFTRYVASFGFDTGGTLAFGPSSALSATSTNLLVPFPGALTFNAPCAHCFLRARSPFDAHDAH